MKIKLITLFLMLVFLLSGWAPPPQDIHGTIDETVDTATSYTLLVNNKTGQKIQLKLVGPTTYNFTVNPGKTTFTVQAGKYRYSYYACNGTKNGTVVVDKNKKLLTLAACKARGKPVKMVKVTVQNNTGGNIRLVLTGPATYDLQIKTGANIIQVVKGKYQYTAYGCGTSNSGTVNMRQGLNWKFWCS